jgi:phosphoglycerate dehydrogenase-like enzyme
VERYLPLDWLPENAVLTNSSGVHAEKGGTFGAMAVLMLNEGVPRQFTNQRHSRWDGRLSTSIRGKTVLIYGFGSLGEAIADRLRPFGPRIAGVRRSGQAHPSADRMLRPDEIHAILPEVDILVVSCPLTRETRDRFGACELDLLPRGASVFNIARAAVMDYRALCDRLISGHISGAILDVFDEEPLPKESYLWDVPNLVISPHVSCDDADGYIERCLGIFAKNVRNWMEKRPLINVVDSFREY